LVLGLSSAKPAAGAAMSKSAAITVAVFIKPSRIAMLNREVFASVDRQPSKVSLADNIVPGDLPQIIDGLRVEGSGASGLGAPHFGEGEAENPAPPLRGSPMGVLFHGIGTPLRG
jgi:hypothetical protein